MIDFKNKKILITGAQGQLGSALTSLLKEYSPISIDINDLDLTNLDHLNQFLETQQPDIIFNAAAYTQVDLAETEVELNNKINTEVPKALALYSLKNNALLIHYSTDYVYSGDGKQHWTENDSMTPQNKYGQAKSLGEKAIHDHCSNYYIFRTSWVYDHKRKNFFTTMLKLASDRDQLKVVNDQMGAPTYAPHLAQLSLQAVTGDHNSPQPHFGTYNLCNKEVTSWFEFAQNIFHLARSKNISLKIKEVLPIPSSDYPVPAKRPLNSRMNLSKFESTFQLSIPTWREGLNSCMEKYLGEINESH